MSRFLVVHSSYGEVLCSRAVGSVAFSALSTPGYQGAVRGRLVYDAQNQTSATHV